MQRTTGIDELGSTTSRCIRREWGTAEHDDPEPSPGAPVDDLAGVQQVLDLSPLATLIVDGDARVLLHNAAAVAALNTHADDLSNGRFQHRIDDDPYELVLRDQRGTEHAHRVESRPFLGLGSAAHIVTLHPSSVAGHGAARSAATDGTYDRLTKLPSRELLLNRLHAALRHSGSRDDARLAVIALDLERFTRINHWFGPAVGDRILRAVANRLTSVVGPHDFVSRMGGDEFAVMLEARCTADHLDVADRIASVLSQPIEVDGVEHLCSPVIGVAEAITGDDEAALLAAAEHAVAEAVPGTPRLARRHHESTESPRARSIRASLPTAASEGQMMVHFQPIFTVEERALVGLEALARWEHPDDGLIAPDEFIDIAEETGAIVPLGEWVISEVCEQIADWRATCDGYVVPPVSINVTSRQLAHPDLRHHVLFALASHGLEPGAIRFEITEDALADPDPQVAIALCELASDGIAIDLDEFGTGLSSLTQLQGNPISGIKLARTFVTRMMDDEPSSLLVLAGIEVARALGISVTAIGVETRDQYGVLTRWGCERAQGYLLARPVNHVEASRFFPRDPEAAALRRHGEPILRSAARSDVWSIEPDVMTPSTLTTGAIR